MTQSGIKSNTEAKQIEYIVYFYIFHIRNKKIGQIQSDHLDCILEMFIELYQEVKAG